MSRQPIGRVKFERDENGQHRSDQQPDDRRKRKTSARAPGWRHQSARARPVRRRRHSRSVTLLGFLSGISVGFIRKNHGGDFAGVGAGVPGGFCSGIGEGETRVLPVRWRCGSAWCHARAWLCSPISRHRWISRRGGLISIFRFGAFDCFWFRRRAWSGCWRKLPVPVVKRRALPLQPESLLIGRLWFLRRQVTKSKLHCAIDRDSGNTLSLVDPRVRIQFLGRSLMRIVQFLSRASARFCS